MKITIVGYGTEGDARPMGALALGLRDAGREVVLVGDISARDMAVGNDFEFHCLEGSIRGSLAPGGALSRVVEKGRFSPASLLQMREWNDEAWLRTIMEAARGADVMVAMPIVASFALSAAWSLGIPAVVGYLQPLSPTKAYPPAGLGFRRTPAIVNKPLGHLVRIGGWGIIGRRINRVRRAMGEPKIGNLAKRTRELCAWSPTLVPQPPDWDPSQTTVTGQWQRSLDPGWDPPSDLAEFLDGGEPPVHVGLGSIPSFTGIESLITAILDGLDGRRCLLSGGWAGLDVERLPDSVRPISFAPFDWLFPRCSVSVHHAGAGTAHLAARAGIPSVTVPIAMDQPFWAERMSAVGVGARPLDRRRVTASAVRAALDEVARLSCTGELRACRGGHG